MRGDEDGNASAQLEEDKAFLEKAKQAQTDFAARWLREIDPRVEPALILRPEPRP